MLLASCGVDEEHRLMAAQARIQSDILEEAAGETTPRALEKKPAKCLLWPENFRGACVFDPLGRGSFAVTREDDKPFYGDVSEIMVFVYGAGKADVRANGADGESLRLGEAKRSETYPACWIGDGFSVCAY